MLHKINKKVIIALSGGVDSSVAALLLKQKGYSVIGIFLKFWHPEITGCSQNVCCDYNALNNARELCNQLQIPFYAIDLKKKFKHEIVDYFISEYSKGKTPNPCVVCNKNIKFRWLLNKAKELGAEYIATGHYSRIFHNSHEKFNIALLEKDEHFLLGSQASSKRLRFTFSNKAHLEYFLLKAKDGKKDQSYYLWQLDQEYLKHVLFPIGNLTKSEVRKIAKKNNLSSWDKKESQDICFLPKKSKKEFFQKYAKEKIKPGNIVDKNGIIIGKHKGLIYYTIGQRENISNIDFKKLSIKINQNRIPPLYVIKLKSYKNELVIGEEKDLYKKELSLLKINWIINYNKLENLKIWAKVRSNAELVSCKIKKDNGKFKVEFNKPIRAITPGQSIVFYHKNILLGGAVI